MKRYLSISLSLLFTLGAFAQKSEIRSMKRILEKNNPTEADYRELQSIIDGTTPYIANAKAEEQAEFYYHKGSFELQQAIKANNVEALSKAVESFNRLRAAEQDARRKTYTDKLDKEVLPVLKPQAFQKALDFNDNKRFREASGIFKAIY